jgi:hypothetical protein
MRANTFQLCTVAMAYMSLYLRVYIGPWDMLCMILGSIDFLHGKAVLGRSGTRTQI